MKYFWVIDFLGVTNVTRVTSITGEAYRVTPEFFVGVTGVTKKGNPISMINLIKN